VVRFEHESAEPPVASLENPVEVEERHSQIANLALVLRDGRKLSAQEAERLEQSLEREPEDLASRARLLAYYFSGSIKDRGAEAKIAARRRHILWLVQHHPESELAGTSVASLDRSGHVLADAEGYEKARQLWIESASRADADSSVLLNAARFFRLSEKPRAETYLLRGREQRPTEPEFSLALGHLYALAILGTTMTNQNGLISRADPIEANSEFAQRARAALQQSEDAALLGSAGYLLMFQGAMLAQLGQIESDPSALAQQCIARAKALDPQNPAHASTMAQFYQTQAKASQSAEEKMEWWRKALVELEQAVELTPDPEERFSRLTNLTKNAFEAGELAKAETRANQLLALAAEFRSSWNYGNAVHHGNLVIGRILLRRGEIEAAKRRLLEAGGTPGSAQLDSFGPNMSLAKELLERGEKEIVLGYFQRCASFWKMDYGKLARWRAEVEAGRIPNFGANLLY
jgi:tetratricopeptide (TPR) repeat protein